MKKDTLLTISERTGFSVSTISRVLSGTAAKSRISQKTIDYIKEEAARCNYTPNLLAKGLRAGKSFTIGLSVPGIEDPFFATLASLIITKLREMGYNTILSDSAAQIDNFAQSLSIFKSWDVDGILAVAVGTSPKLLEDIFPSTPVVLVDRIYEHSSLPYVTCDNHLRGYLAAEYLISRGYRRLLAIRGIPSSMPSRDRERGFLDAIIAHPELGIECNVVGDAFTEENGYIQTRDAFKDGLKYDALFTFTASSLIGALKALRELHLRVPEDVAIMTFDNNSRVLDYLHPAVTRIEQPVTEIGRTAVELLLRIIEKGNEEVSEDESHIIFKPTLVVRDSC